MAGASVAELTSRAVVAIEGPDAAALLDRLVTVDTDAATLDRAAFGALLSPQGKILTDFLLVRNGAESFLIDLPKVAAADFVKRMTMYKLRAQVTVRDVSDTLAVIAVWDADGAPTLPGRVAEDPRGLGYRGYVQTAAVGAAEALPGAVIADETAFQTRRIEACLPEAGADYPFGDAFPHDVAMDQLSGVDFTKGCYVGQEVVSRMQHRGTARRRPLVVTTTAGALPAPGTEITAGGKPVGVLGSTAGAVGIALGRLDRVTDAMTAGEPILAGDVPVALTLPPYAHYSLPPSGPA